MTTTSYPVMRYHRNGVDTKKVNSPEEDATLNDDTWTDRPVAVKPAEAPDCPKCSGLRSQFDEAWDKITRDHRELLERHTTLSQEFQRVVDAHAAKTAECDELAKANVALVEAQALAEAAVVESKKKK
jgi:hypothetical protein